MSTFRRTPIVWLVIAAWLGVHALALALAGQTSIEGAPWYAWGSVPQDLLQRLGADVPALVRLGEERRVLTYAFLHGMALNLLLGIWILWGSGRQLETVLGPARFWVVLVLSVAGGGIAHAVWGIGPLVGGWPAIVGILGALLVWAFLSPDPAARASRGSTVLFLVILGALALTFGGQLWAELGGLVAGAVGMALLKPWAGFTPAGSGARALALCLLVLVVGAGGLQAFATRTVDTDDARVFLRDLAEAEKKGRAIARAPHKATPTMKNDLAMRLAALREPACLSDNEEAVRALDAYLDIWEKAARGDIPDPFGFDAALKAAGDAWRQHEAELRAVSGIPRSWSGWRR